VQNLPRLWDLFNDCGMSMLELKPIRTMPADGSVPLRPMTPTLAQGA
jgi:hypothetical protein